ncbi:MAG: DNA cytosine methyltransferase [Pseudomonadaceae bacterium]|nr:DNA cytosine methyltransferase [Pseudomonadaceae bacterium]
MITYGSVCSGIEAASVAWHPLGWSAEWLAEIEPFPSAVLAHRYPETPNLGDMTKLAAMVLSGKIAAPDVLVGGTPCQAFSVAGMRQGLDDPRGALTIKYVELADAIDHVRASRGEPPAIAVWENVPGVLSDKGNAFGCFLGALAGEDNELQPSGGRWTDAGCVYGPKRAIAWRVLDAQYFGLAQRRRRVFVVASARQGFDPAAVLFERDSVRRDIAPSRKAGQDAAGSLTASLGRRGGVPDCASTPGQLQPVTCMAHGQGGAEIATDRSPTLTCNHEAPIVVHGTQDPCVSDKAFALGRNSGQENAVFCREVAGTITSNYGKQVDGSDTALGPNIVAFSCKDHGADAGPISPTLRAMSHNGSHANAGGQVAVCVTGDITHSLKADGFDGSEDGTGRGQPIVSVALRGREGGATAELGDDVAGCLRASGGGGDKAHVLAFSTVRRLTPVECERLQGFPDNHTEIPWRNKPADECPDGPRYKAIGNSKAVPVVRWIGQRIQQAIA